jgi:hypothetical protein
LLLLCLLRSKKWLVPSPSVSVTFAGQRASPPENCRGEPSRVTVEVDSDQPYPM